MELKLGFGSTFDCLKIDDSLLVAAGFFKIRKIVRFIATQYFIGQACVTLASKLEKPTVLFIGFIYRCIPVEVVEK